MRARLQQRVQRYGWDLAAADYESLWHAQLAPAQDALVAGVALRSGERALDIACGTGLVTFEAARAVGPNGHVVGTDLSGRMIDVATALAVSRAIGNVTFERMDAEALRLPAERFDAVLCALGLMYVPDAERAVCEMRRVLRPGGRVGIAVWGERRACGWSSVFEIVDAEVASDVCPMFFRLGAQGALAAACTAAGFAAVETRRIDTILHYADGDEACHAAFIGGPVALAWSRFDPVVRERVRVRYLEAIAPWSDGAGYAVPASFVVVTGHAR